MGQACEHVRSFGFYISTLLALFGCATLTESPSQRGLVATSPTTSSPRHDFGSGKSCSFRSVDAFAAAGDASGLRRCLETGENLAAGPGSTWTPLHWAVWSGNLEAVEVLLSRGADANARSSTGHTPLHFAAQKGDLDMARLLVRYGADARADDQLGHTALSEAPDTMTWERLLSYPTSD